MKKPTTVRLTTQSHEWLAKQAKQQGVSINNLIQMFINEKMKQDQELAVV